MSWTHVLETDYTLYDLSMRWGERLMERKLVAHICGEEGLKDFDSCLRLLSEAQIVHVDGWKVAAPMQRFSGEPGTSIFNGLFQAFRIFLTCVVAGHTFDTSMFFCEGDDGLDGISSAFEAELVSRYLGLELKCEEHSTVLTTTFLGRHNAFVHGKLTSCCDFDRTLRKFHLTARPAGYHGGWQSLLAAKSLSYMATDYRTPVIGAMAWAYWQWHRQYLHPSALTVNDIRLKLSGYNVEDIKEWGPPEFDDELAVTIAYHTGKSISYLRHYHHAYLLFGAGGSEPGPIDMVVKEGRESLWVFK
jgi:hypothetical protein